MTEDLSGERHASAKRRCSSSASRLENASNHRNLATDRVLSSRTGFLVVGPGFRALWRSEDDINPAEPDLHTRARARFSPTNHQTSPSASPASGESYRPSWQCVIKTKLDAMPHPGYSNDEIRLQWMYHFDEHTKNKRHGIVPSAYLLT
ncbi:hypothetical protein HRG_014176 [Hirsutella rhossiliensis]